MMTTIHVPRTVEAATLLLQRHAEIEGAVALIENARNDAIAVANTAADEQLEPLITERDTIRAKLEPWWQKAAAALTGGKRKSIELGGCMIGTRAGRDSLGVDGDDEEIAGKLSKRAWAKPLLRVTTKLDRKAVLQSIDGVYKKQLASLGLSRKPGPVTFFVERADQSGTSSSTRP